MHWEPSTHGEGMHGYGILDLGEDHGHVTAGERKDVVNKMQDDLRKVAAHYGADVELVEVKGHPPVIDSAGIHQTRNTQIIRSMTYGQFAKVPRNLEAVAALEPVSLVRLAEIAAEVPDVVLTDRTKKTASSGGSCTGKVVTEEMLAMMPELEKVGEGLLAGRSLLEGRKVTAYDVACVLLLAWMFALPANANPDGAMPTRRFEAMWDSLYEAGDFERGWSPNRFKAARDLLSAEGLIHWIDETYCHNEPGRRAGVPVVVDGGDDGSHRRSGLEWGRRREGTLCTAPDGRRPDHAQDGQEPPPGACLDRPKGPAGSTRSTCTSMPWQLETVDPTADP